MRFETREQEIEQYYRTLHDAYGAQHWWPARTRFEVIVGAYLTQNTSWNNVEAALRRLRQAHALSLAAIRTMPVAELQSLVRAAGYFRQKAARLKIFVDFLDRRYSGSLKRMFSQPAAKLRQELLELNGIGPETADSILLYAGQHEVFVVDAYTRRILDRHGILPASADYQEIRALFERSLSGVSCGPPFQPAFVEDEEDARRKRGAHVVPARSTAHEPSRMSLAPRSQLAQIYNDMHGLLVAVGKHYCLKAKAQCEGCPLQKFLPADRRKDRE